MTSGIEQDSAAAASGRSPVPEQVRVAIEVDGRLIDQSLVARRRLAAVMESLIPVLEDKLPGHDFTTKGAWTLAREGGTHLSRRKTLVESGITDGDRLILAESYSDQVFRPIIESTADAIQEYCRQRLKPFTRNTALTLGFTGLVLGAFVFAAVVLRSWAQSSSALWWFPPAAIAAVAAVVGALSAYSRWGMPRLSYALQLASIPLLFTAGFVLVPADGGFAGRFTAANILLGSAFVLIGAALVGRITRLGPTVIGSVSVGAIVTIGASILFTYTPLGKPAIPAIGVIAGLILTHFAQTWALRLAGIQPDPLPPPGEDIDRSQLDSAAIDVDTFDDKSTTELARNDENVQLERKTRTASRLLTGFYAAIAMTLVVSALTIIQVGTHYFWGEFAIAVLTAGICLLRGRAVDDRIHALTFYTAGFVIASGVALIMVTASSTNVGRMAVVIVTGLLVATCAAAGVLLAPFVTDETGDKRAMSARLLGRIELFEKASLVMIVLLALWVTRIFAAAREMNLSFLK